MDMLKIKIACSVISILSYLVKDKEKKEGLSKLKENLKTVMDM